MAIKLVAFLLLFGLVAKASSFLSPDLDLFTEASNVINLKCSVLASLVKMFPLSYPRQENIFFELRKPCRRFQYPVARTQELRNNPVFKVTNKTVVFLAGWKSKVNDEPIESLTKAYLCRGGFNFIVVNPSEHLRTEYINSAYNIEQIGKFVAMGLKNLNVPGKRIHLIGHSLGAHAMGSAGRHFTALTNDKIGRITGLDPARPCFINTPVFSRLSTNDATFVDIIHSNPTEAGTEEAIGHADFYPGGIDPSQPGCTNLICSHGISFDYYTETVYKGNANNFLSTRCDSYAQLETRTCSGNVASMGFAANASAPGIYILDVNANAPYGKNASSTNYLNWNKCGVCQTQ